MKRLKRSFKSEILSFRVVNNPRYKRFDNRNFNHWYGLHSALAQRNCVRASHTFASMLLIGCDAPQFASLPFSGKALVRLVMLDYVCCQTSICILSTLCSATGLTSLCYERSHLMVGFVLICFQHLSAWNTATGRLPLAG